MVSNGHSSARFPVVQKKDYWKRLKSLKLYSLQRRRERYRIIYIWKVLEGHVPNVNNKVISTLHTRLGRKCKIPSIPSGRLGKIREASLAFNGAKLFNVLPKPLRDMSGVKLEAFKSALDRFLRTIPDEPQIPGYTACRRADSNSIIHMLHVNKKSVAGFHLLPGAVKLEVGLALPSDE